MTFEIHSLGEKKYWNSIHVLTTWYTDQKIFRDYFILIVAWLKDSGKM